MLNSCRILRYCRNKLDSQVWTAGDSSIRCELPTCRDVITPVFSSSMFSYYAQLPWLYHKRPQASLWQFYFHWLTKTRLKKNPKLLAQWYPHTRSLPPQPGCIEVRFLLCRHWSQAGASPSHPVWRFDFRPGVGSRQWDTRDFSPKVHPRNCAQSSIPCHFTPPSRPQTQCGWSRDTLCISCITHRCRGQVSL